MNAKDATKGMRVRLSPVGIAKNLRRGLRTGKNQTYPIPKSSYAGFVFATPGDWMAARNLIYIHRDGNKAPAAERAEFWEQDQPWTLAEMVNVNGNPRSESQPECSVVRGSG